MKKKTMVPLVWLKYYIPFTLGRLQLLIIFASMFVYPWSANAGRQGIPHPIGNGGDYSENSAVARSGNGSVNIITGQPYFQSNFFNISSKSGFSVGADLYYNGNVQSQAALPNETILDNWCGFGWIMGWSSILVDHKGTTSSDDDQWFFKYSEGTVSEIVKSGSIYKIKNDPYWKVVPEFATLTDGDIPIITGWTITQPNGCIYRYGDFVLSCVEASYNGSRTIWRGTNSGDLKNDNFLQLIMNPSLFKPFIYRWDLKTATDVNGSTISFEYQQTRFSGNGIFQCVSSCVKKISSDAGYNLLFNLENKSVSEDKLNSQFGFSIVDKQFLRSIQLMDGTREIERLVFSYTGDNAQEGHLNSSRNGYAKRLLTGIISSNKYSETNYNFKYDQGAFPGYLTQLSQPMTGNTTKYTYGVKALTYTVDANSQVFGAVTVDRISVSNGMPGTSTLVKQIAYSTDVGKYFYVPSTRMAYFGETTVNSGTGTGSEKYIIDVDATSHRFGSVIRTDILNEAGNIAVSKTSTEVAQSFFSDAFTYLLDTRTVKTSSKVNMVSGTPFCSYASVPNGIPSISYATNSDGVSLVTKNEFACQHYTEMSDGVGGKNMLTQIASTKNYKISGYTGNCTLDDTKIISATFTTWSDASGIWRPDKTYAWKVPMDGSGEIQRDGGGNPAFFDFDKSNPTSNNWIKTGETTKYDEHGNVLETKDALGRFSVKIYRNDYQLPIGVVNNSEWLECGVFTGDYKAETNPNFWDYKNGWEKGNSNTVELSENEDHTHFGKKVIHIIQDYAAGRNNRIYPGRAYTMSAWVKVTEGAIKMATDFRYAEAGHENDWPVTEMVTVTTPTGIFATPITKNDCDGKWKLMSLEIPGTVTAQLDQTARNAGLNPATTVWYARSWVGDDPVKENPSDPDLEAYVDDIRFAPSNSMVTSTYYDQIWHKPVVSIDGNNKPGQQVNYDNFGRAIKWKKLDPLKSANDAGFGTLLKEKKYHVMGDDLRLTFPNGNEVIRCGQQYTISWVEGDVDLDIEGVDIKFYNGSTWVPVAGATELKNQTSFVWTVPTIAATDCQIEVVSHQNSTISDRTDGTFAILSNSAPSAPVLTTPAMNEEIEFTSSESQNDKLINLAWTAATDPDNDPLSYRVTVAGTVIVDNYRSTACPVTITGLGNVAWTVEVRDAGGLSNCATGNFLIIQNDWFILRDVYDKIVDRIPSSSESDLYNQIYASLSSSDQAKFAATYPTLSAGFRWLAIDVNSELLTDGNTISYIISTATELGDPVWKPLVKDGDITGLVDREIRNFRLYRADGATNPQLLIKVQRLSFWNNPYEQSGTWATNFDPPTTHSNDVDDEINKFYFSTTTTGYHFWYRAWPRDQGSSWSATWKTNGQWTNSYSDGASHVQIYLFKY